MKNVVYILFGGGVLYLLISLFKKQTVQEKAKQNINVYGGAGGYSGSSFIPDVVAAPLPVVGSAVLPTSPITVVSAPSVPVVLTSPSGGGTPSVVVGAPSSPSVGSTAAGSTIGKTKVISSSSTDSVKSTSTTSSSPSIFIP